MVSRGLHALFASLPALVAFAIVVLVAGRLLEQLHEAPAASATILTAMLLWPLLPASAVLAGRAASAWAVLGTRDPMRSLGIAAVGGVWRIPVRAIHPRTTGLLAALIAGGAMAALARGGLLGSPAWWHAGAAVGGSLVLGVAAFAVGSVLDRQASRAMVLDPREGVLLLPATRQRRQVVRIRLARVRWIRVRRDGLLTRRFRVESMFDDEVLGPGVRDSLLAGVDPGRALDLVAWLKPFVLQATTAPAAAPPAVLVDHAAESPAAAVEAAPMSMSTPTPHRHAAVAAAPASIMPERRRPRRSRLASINMPLALSMLGLASIGGLMAMGVRIQPRQSTAAPMVAVSDEGTLGLDAAGRRIDIADLAPAWCWEVAVEPSDPAVPLQVTQLTRLAEHLPSGVVLRIVLVGGRADHGATAPMRISRFAERMQLPESVVLVRTQPADAPIGHRLIDARGRVVHRDSGFMSAAAMQRQIELMRTIARMGGGS